MKLNVKVNELQILHLAVLAKNFPTKCGYLEKKSGKKVVDQTSVRWQRRWCAVYYNFMFYYETESSPKPQGVILLDGVRTDELEVTELPCFGIRVARDEGREYLFGCESDAEREEWVQVINSSSANAIWERNDNLVHQVQALENDLQSLKEEKERLNQELNDNYQQVTRLKLELSSVREQAMSFKNRRASAGSLITLRNEEESSSNSVVTASDFDIDPSDMPKIIKLQNAIRSWLLRRRWKGLIQSYISTFTADKLKQRNQLLWQFITSEEDYVHQLNVLVGVFLHPIKQRSFNSQIISSTEVTKIFANSESILVLHKIFVEGMAMRMKDWPAVQIDDLLFSLVAAVPIYIEYIKNHPEALKTLCECKKRPEFVKMLSWCEAKEECHGQTIEQFLLYPVRVMPTYVRNIFEILEMTPEEHNERKALESILHKLQEAQTYNHYLDEGESIRHTLEIERLIDGGCIDLLDGEQTFIRHGILKQIGLHEPRFPSGRREKTRHCFLFSKHLIIASRTIDGRLRLSKNAGVVPLHHTSLAEEDIGSDFPEYMKNRAFKLLVEIPMEEDKVHRNDIVLMANKSNEKTLWATDITQCIYNLALEDNPSSDEEDKKSDDPDITESGKSGKDVVDSPAYALGLKEDRRLRDNDEDIEYSEEVSGPYHLPQIMHASVDRLIERLADPRLPGAEFMETFLLTYRAFTTSDIVIRGLIEAYWKVMGGYPTPKKSNSPERKKLAVSRSLSSGHPRSRLRSNASDASSTDDLDASFNSGISPCGASTTVFNYSTLKDQLNSPAKRNVAATTKWCQDSAAVTAAEKPFSEKLRSASASNIGPIPNELTVEPNGTDARKISRSHSIEVIYDKNDTNAKKSSFVSAVTSKSCDQIDDPSAFSGDPLNKKVNILSIVLNKENRPSTNNENKENIPEIILNGHNDQINNNDIKFSSHENSLSASLNSSQLSASLNQSQLSASLNQSDLSGVSDASTLYENGQLSNESFNGEVIPNENEHCGEGFMDEGPSILEDVVEEDDHMIISASLDSTGRAPNSIAISLDDSYLEDGERRSTMESNTTLNSSNDKSDIFSLDRSVTMDSMNSFASSDISTEQRSDGETSSSNAGSRSVVHSHSDELICKQREAETITLPPKSASLSEKKSGISPYFRRKNKGKKEKAERKQKAKSMADILSDEPVLVSIKETGDGRMIFDDSQSLYEEVRPLESPVTENKTFESSSIPIPVPALAHVTKKSPNSTPKRKRSLYFQKVFNKVTVRRAASEQNLSDMSPTTPTSEMKPALSAMSLELNGNANGHLPKVSPKDHHPDFEMGTRSLERKKNAPSLRERLSAFTQLSSSEMDIHKAGLNSDNKNTLKKEKKKFKNSLRILSASPKETTPSQSPIRRKTSTSVIEKSTRPQLVTRKSISINRGPLKIMSIFKHWLAKHPKDFLSDPEMITILEKFFDDIKSDERTLPVVKEIVGSLEKSVVSHRKSLAAVHPFDELLLQQHSLRNVQQSDINEEEELNKCTQLHAHPPNIVAANMTLLEHYLYSKISFNEFVSCQWTKKDKNERAPGIMRFIDRFNHVTSIISYGVVHGSTIEYRSQIIEFWIKTAAHCRDLNNFNACVEIVSALNASAVHRLKKSWEQVSKPLREVFNDLDALVSADRSFKNLREAVHMCNPPCVPYLGCYLSDLLFAHEGGKTFNGGGLVNFAKMCRVSRLVREVKCYQQLPYTLELNKEVAFSLVNWDVEVNQDLLYDQSLLAEPRESSR